MVAAEITAAGTAGLFIGFDHERFLLVPCGYLFEDKLVDAIHMLFAVVLVVCGLFETREFDAGVLQDYCFIL